MLRIWYIGFKRRMVYLLISSLIFIIIYYIGASTNLSDDDAKLLKEEFEKQIKGIDYNGIFLNNFRASVLMFIPALGVIIGLFTAYMTGAVFKAFTLTLPQLANINPLLILITPFGIMEIFSYGLSISQSVILIRAIVNKRINKELIYSTFIQVGIVALILFIAAVIEYYMLKSLDTNII